MTETTRQTDRLRQLQELRAFLDTQIEELTAREHHRKLELCCSADKTLVGAGEPVLVWGVVHNSGCEAVENLHLELRLPSGLQLLPEGGRLYLPSATGSGSGSAAAWSGRNPGLVGAGGGGTSPGREPHSDRSGLHSAGRTLPRGLAAPVDHRPELQPQTGRLQHGRCPGPVEPGPAVRAERVRDRPAAGVSAGAPGNPAGSGSWKMQQRLTKLWVEPYNSPCVISKNQGVERKQDEVQLFRLCIGVQGPV